MKTATKKSKKSAPKNEKKAEGRAAVEDATNPVLDPEVGVEAPAAPAAEASDAPAAEGESFELAYHVVEYPLDKIDVSNGIRVPTEAAVGEMVASIKKNGLLNPIILDAEGHIIAGRTRVLAARKLGWTTIAARFSVDAKGNPITIADGQATIAAIAENINRTQMTPVELGRVAKDAVARGIVGSDRELAGKLGVSPGALSRAIAIADKAAGPVADAIASGELSVTAGAAIVARCADHRHQREALESVRAAVKGKGEKRQIADSDVDEVVPPRNSNERREAAKGRARAGRPVEKVGIPGEATNLTESGIRVTLRKTSTEGEKAIVVEMTISTKTETFARYDLEAAIQKSASKLSKSDVNRALEEARQRIFG